MRDLKRRRIRGTFYYDDLAAGVVLTTATYLHYARLLRVLAVLTAILTAFFARAIASRVFTLVLFLVLSHVNTPYSPT